MNIGAILMASGAGVRFGSNKLLFPVAGVPLFQRSFAACPPALFTAAVVVSCYEEVLKAAQAAGYEPVYNPFSAEGQAASLRLGLEAVAQRDGYLFAVCDQPYLTAQSVGALLAAHHDAPRGTITALSYGGRRGNPVIFDDSYREELLSLAGDTGGKAVIAAHQDRILLVEAGAERELLDLDSAADVETVVKAGENIDFQRNLW